MKVSSRISARLLGWCLIALLLTGLSTTVATATVDYARQTGQPCGACHVRAEGGGELNPQGIAYARGGYQWPIPEDVTPYTPSNLVKVSRLIVGYIHLTVAIIWFGTIFYVYIVLRPRRLTTGVPKTEGTIGWISIGVMAVTGIVLTILRYRETGSVFVGTFGVVFIIKLAQFAWI